jgi:dethiobiotin synthetase
VAGIHTGIGKTMASTLLVEALHFDYWKPVQAGDLHASDSHFVQNHISNPVTTIHPEAYRLKKAVSPHAAAASEGIKIKIEHCSLPSTTNGMIIETAGGVFSPLCNGITNIDLMKQLGCPVVLVTQDYLGSINHTLLTIHALRTAGLSIAGIIFNGREVTTSRRYITQHSGLTKLLTIPHFDDTSGRNLMLYAACIASQLKRLLHGFCSS